MKHLSQADLDYCIKKGIISKADARFLVNHSDSEPVPAKYKHFFDILSARMSHYSGIATTVVLKMEEVATRNSVMRSFRDTMHEHYATRATPEMMY